MLVDPVVGIDEHQQPAAARHDQRVDGVDLPAAVEIVRTLRFRWPVRLEKFDARVIGEIGRPVVAGDDDAEILIGLGQNGIERQLEEALDQRPVPRTETRQKRDTESERNGRGQGGPPSGPIA
jgi:hypothetical protein